ncbi:hypothetical protein [Methanonatronarchaeum sp. AMET-Sl]|uniref:hypothetical protein n=1 Tax=Methanonatronarchaeum sp. AMET-Sl TaxID=3037654 RepID=UPI00244DC38C|nr:hypothetical protein [Methanonatronarchaeum sp. AMET-Sl]WGI17441.1 hypothetical protein QEN48_00095 [Methanonatronarchaeum sp. AMET-Sl]
MTEFERDLVKSFNSFFEREGVRAIAYRRKQHRFSSQFVDILVDSIKPEFYIAIENKSISTAKGAKKLYFSQHFSENQVERIDKFLNKSGRRGYLAVELKQGRGNPRKAFLIPWDEVITRYKDGENGFGVNEIKEFREIKRNGKKYRVKSFFKEGS